MVGSLEYLLITSIWVPPYLALKPMVTIPHFHYWVSHYIPIKWLLNANFSPLFSHGFHGSSIFPWYSHSYSITYSHDIPVDGWEILHHQAWMLFQHKSWDVYHQLVQDFAGPSTVIIIVYIYIYIYIISLYIIFPWYSTLFLYYPSMIPFPRRYHHFRWEPLGSSDSIASWADRSWQSPVECNWRPGATAWVEWSIDLSYLYIYIYMHMYICTYLLYIYIYMYTCMYISIFRIYRLDDVYVRNNSLGGEMHGIPCGTAICWVVSVRVFEHCEHAKYGFYLRLIAFLRLPQNYILKRILKISSVICSVSSR